MNDVILNGFLKGLEKEASLASKSKEMYNKVDKAMSSTAGKGYGRFEEWARKHPLEAAMLTGAGGISVGTGAENYRMSKKAVAYTPIVNAMSRGSNKLVSKLRSGARGQNQAAGASTGNLNTVTRDTMGRRGLDWVKRNPLKTTAAGAGGAGFALGSSRD